jgi:hypothetical protein
MLRAGLRTARRGGEGPLIGVAVGREGLCLPRLPMLRREWERAGPSPAAPPFLDRLSTVCLFRFLPSRRWGNFLTDRFRQLAVGGRRCPSSTGNSPFLYSMCLHHGIILCIMRCCCWGAAARPHTSSSQHRRLALLARAGAGGTRRACRDFLSDC